MDQERRMVLTSDDPTMLKQVEATHAPDHALDVDVMPILDILEGIFQRATLSLDHAKLGGKQRGQALEGKTTEAVINATAMFEGLAYVIQNVSYEISYKSSGGEDAHLTAMSVLHTLSKYSWDAKVVITMGALAVTYGEFWLFVQFYAMHPVAKYVAALKDLEDLIENSDTLKSQFEILNDLINVMLDVTKVVVELRQLLHQNTFTDQQSPLSTAITHLPTAAYWTIRSVVACATHIVSLIGISHWRLTPTTRAWELLSFAHKERNIHKHLVQQLDLCYQHRGEKPGRAIGQTLRHILEASHVDNTRFLRHLIYLKDDTLPLVDGSTKSRVHVEVLRAKTVLLLISDLDHISFEELAFLNDMYKEPMARAVLPYEIVWLPIVDKSSPWTEAQQQKFETLNYMMPWYTLRNPKLLEPAAVSYIKEVWRFSKKTIMVVLDPQAKVVCPNALPMLCIWGNSAYPFTNSKEEALWSEETWSLELVANGIEPLIHDWKAQGKYICLYGGQEIDWIRKFTHTAKQVAAAAGIELELVYVGKSKQSRENFKEITETIGREHLSHYLPDLTLLRYFWTRLECMLYSKIQHCKNVENDQIIQEVMTILSFDASDLVWATIWFGSTEMARSRGYTILESFRRFEEWQENAKDPDRFVLALREHLQQLYTPQHCFRLVIPADGARAMIPETMSCAECGSVMEKFITFLCNFD